MILQVFISFKTFLLDGRDIQKLIKQHLPKPLLQAVSLLCMTT